LLYALTKDAALTQTSTSSYPNFSPLPGTSTAYLPKLWLLTKVTSSSHAVRSLNILIGTYYTWSVSSTITTVTATTDPDVVPYSSYPIVKSNTATTTTLFTTAQVLKYVTLVAAYGASPNVTYYASASATNTHSYGINNATSSVIGTLNADALISNSSLNSFVNPTPIQGLYVLFEGNLANLYILGLSLSKVIAALNINGATTVTPSNAATAGWSTADITAAFSFSELTSSGISFTYVSFASAPDSNGSNRTLVDKCVSLYTSTNTTFYAAVNARFYVLKQSSVSLPTTTTDVRRAVISYLLSIMQFDPTGIQTLENGKVRALSNETIAFVATLLPSDGSISYRDVYHIGEVASVDNVTSATVKFSFSDLANTFKYSPKEVTTLVPYYSVYLNGSLSTQVTPNSWSSSRVLSYWGPNTIFSAANATINTITGATTYPVPIVAAFKNTGSSSAVIKAVGTSGYTASDIYDGIPYSSIVAMVGENAVVSAVIGDLQGTTSILAGTAAVAAMIPAIFDALRLTLAQAKQYIGKFANYDANRFTIGLSHIAAMTSLSPAQRRCMFSGIGDAANQYALAGQDTAGFLNLGYTAADWYTYISAGNLSVNVTMYDLLSLTENVKILDSEFYLSTTDVTRAVYHTLADRKLIVKAFIPNASDALQEQYATAAFQDLPRPI